jgi:hypothetical protein
VERTYDALMPGSEVLISTARGALGPLVRA